MYSMVYISFAADMVRNVNIQKQMNEVLFIYLFYIRMQVIVYFLVGGKKSFKLQKQ